MGSSHASDAARGACAMEGLLAAELGDAEADFEALWSRSFPAEKCTVVRVCLSRTSFVLARL